jgi:hypothetical protein
LNNPRCVDTLYEVYIGRIKKGVTERIEDIPLEKGLESLKVFFAGKK